MHFTVVYLVAKPLIWSEVKRDKVAEVVCLREDWLVIVKKLFWQLGYTLLGG